MTITNHVLAGAIIGLAVTNPAAAVALAFASHFVMDALPHLAYAGKKGYKEVLKHKMSYSVAAITLIATLGILGILAANGATTVSQIAASLSYLGNIDIQ